MVLWAISLTPSSSHSTAARWLQFGNQGLVRGRARRGGVQVFLKSSTQQGPASALKGICEWYWEITKEVRHICSQASECPHFLFKVKTCVPHKGYERDCPHASFRSPTRGWFPLGTGSREAQPLKTLRPKETGGENHSEDIYKPGQEKNTNVLNATERD